MREMLYFTSSSPKLIVAVYLRKVGSLALATTRTVLCNGWPQFLSCLLYWNSHGCEEFNKILYDNKCTSILSLRMNDVLAKG